MKRFRPFIYERAKDIQKLGLIPSPNTQTPESLGELKARLNLFTKGYEELGRGYYSVVLAGPKGGEYVLKINDNKHGNYDHWIDWGQFCMQNKGKPLLPNVIHIQLLDPNLHGNTMYEKPYYAIMEKYTFLEKNQVKDFFKPEETIINLYEKIGKRAFPLMREIMHSYEKTLTDDFIIYMFENERSYLNQMFANDAYLYDFFVYKMKAAINIYIRKKTWPNFKTETIEELNIELLKSWTEITMTPDQESFFYNTILPFIGETIGFADLHLENWAYKNSLENKIIIDPMADG